MTASLPGNRFTFIAPPNRLMIEMLLLFTGLFLLLMIIPSFEAFALKYLALNADSFLSKLYLWQAATSIFLHNTVGQFIINIILFYIFGSGLASSWRRREFLAFFFACGIGSSICTYLYMIISGAGPAIILGASGTIFGLMAGFAITYGEQVIYLFFVIPMKVKYLVYIIIGIQVLLLWRGGGAGHVSQISGALIGWLYLKRVRKQQRSLAGETFGKADAGSRLGGLEVMDDDD